MQQLLKLLFILQTAVRGEPFLGEVTQPRLLSVLTGESVTINCTWIYNGTNLEWIHANFQREPLLGNKNSSIKKLTCVRDVTLGSFRRCFTSLEIENVSFGHSQYNYTCMVKLPKVYPPLESRGQGTRLQIYGNVQLMYPLNQDTIYAFVRRNNLPSNPKHATADPVNEYSNLEEDEEVSYADIVIHNPRRQCCDQQPKQVSNVTEKNARKDFKYMHGSSPLKHIDDTSEYSVVRISHQDLRTV
ncbi:hypothetical protein chiPu_0001669 [Chiloscyllium punctatum]|uniref:Immunoglobulin domain-containing protein n=1 Tax=Chiloscyllium punctatum TaxID=137246 RepID=A0A401RYQ1_CHIPU|nr:hypothetical protein [Chiloscyllium punctatum]